MESDTEFPSVSHELNYDMVGFSSIHPLIQGLFHGYRKGKHA